MNKDIKVRDTIKKMEEDRMFYATASPVMLFAEAVQDTRMEKGGVSIEDIGKCFRAQFDEAELSALIHELNKPKI